MPFNASIANRPALRTVLAGLAGLAFLTGTGSAFANDPVYSIDLNKTQILRLPAAAGAIVIGNPGIADVTVHSPQTLFVVGRGFGETNLIILDRNGETMMDADIQVTAVTPQHGTRLYNGSARRTYSCVPFCQPSPVLGDESAFIGENTVTAETGQGTTTVFEEPAPQFDDQGFNAEAMVELRP
ncbi:MAG: pilus assembly protein N-terminal domain-containing protein [Litorimonas sp.]